jgi:hypothetical protein
VDCDAYRTKNKKIFTTLMFKKIWYKYIDIAQKPTVNYGKYVYRKNDGDKV